MNISFYANNSDNIEVTKNLTPVLVNPVSGTLRGECTVSDPILEVASSDVILNVNYIYIEEFRRYYYVTSIVSVRNGLWALTCHVDVLMSFSQAIKSHSAIIARQENEYNLFLPDNRFIINANRKVVVKKFPNTTPLGSTANAKFVVFTVAGGSGEDVSE